MSQTTVRVRSEADVAEASRLAREAALVAGLPILDAVQLATAVSEIATNQLRHAGGGEIAIAPGPTGVVVEAIDDGPGIEDVEQALSDGFSTRNSLGLGLPGARRLSDEFELSSAPGEGTRIRLAKRFEPVAPERLARWASAGETPGVRAVCEAIPNALVLAVAAERTAAWIEQHPAAPPAQLIAHAGTDPVAVAHISGLDGHLAWLRNGSGDGRLLRRRRSATAMVASPPLGRAGTLGAQRGDLLVLTSAGPVPEIDVTGTPEDIAAHLASSVGHMGTVVVARLERGVLERRGRPG